MGLEYDNLYNFRGFSRINMHYASVLLACNISLLAAMSAGENELRMATQLCLWQNLSL